MNKRVCENIECKKEFIPKINNQKYCCDECCKIATNKRILKEYHEKKKAKNKINVKCKTDGCGTILSQYNSSDTCGKCEAKLASDKRKAILEYLNGNS
jgi:hypothetical protein